MNKKYLVPIVGLTVGVAASTILNSAQAFEQSGAKSLTAREEALQAARIETARVAEEAKKIAKAEIVRMRQAEQEVVRAAAITARAEMTARTKIAARAADIERAKAEVVSTRKMAKAAEQGMIAERFLAAEEMTRATLRAHIASSIQAAVGAEEEQAVDEPQAAAVDKVLRTAAIKVNGIKPEMDAVQAAVINECKIAQKAVIDRAVAIKGEDTGWAQFKRSVKQIFETEGERLEREAAEVQAERAVREEAAKVSAAIKAKAMEAIQSLIREEKQSVEEMIRMKREADIAREEEISAKAAQAEIAASAAQAVNEFRVAKQQWAADEIRNVREQELRIQKQLAEQKALFTAKRKKADDELKRLRAKYLG